VNPAAWTWLLCGGSGQALAELTTATGRSISYRRNAYAEATATLSVDDAAASLIANELQTGWPRLRCYRRTPGANTSALVFNGYFAPLVEQAEVGSTVQITARSPFARLVGASSSGQPLTASQTYTATDAGAIAGALLTSGTATGLAPGTTEATKLRDITYPIGQNTGDAITNLSAMLDGFDFVERFVDTPATLARLDIYARLGTDRPGARFEYGESTLANLRSVGRTTAPPINYVLLLGADGLFSIASDAGSIATYGYWPLTKSYASISVQGTLDDRATSMLRTKPIRTVSMTPETTAPRPFDDYYLGDTVPLNINRASMRQIATARINAFSVLIDDEGNEASEIADPQSPEDEAAIRASIEVEVIAP
jgi:hypothetical protein